VSVDHEILACEAELRRAELIGDVAVLDRLLDDGWRLVAGHMSTIQDAPG